VPVLTASHYLVPVAGHFVIFASLPMLQTYFNCFANYFGINELQTYTKCMLVCAGAGAGASPLASAGSQSFF